MPFHSRIFLLTHRLLLLFSLQRQTISFYPSKHKNICIIFVQPRPRRWAGAVQMLYKCCTHVIQMFVFAARCADGHWVVWRHVHHAEHESTVAERVPATGRVGQQRSRPLRINVRRLYRPLQIRRGKHTAVSRIYAISCRKKKIDINEEDSTHDNFWNCTLGNIYVW